MMECSQISEKCKGDVEVQVDPWVLEFEGGMEELVVCDFHYQEALWAI